MLIAVVLLCIAVIVLSAPSVRTFGWIPLALAAVALLFAAFRSGLPEALR